MNTQRLIAFALVIVVLISGCSSIGSLTGSDTESPSPTATTTEPTETATTPSSTPTPTPVVKTAPGPSTPAQPETWTKPETPRDPENKLGDRISGAEFINKEEASNGNGYTNFDVQVNADTSMEDVDPTPDVAGEPYFTVEINDQLVTRKDAYFREDGTFTLDVHPGALDQFDAGTLSVRVTLYDEDHEFDDRYDKWTGTIEYSGS